MFRIRSVGMYAAVVSPTSTDDTRQDHGQLSRLNCTAIVLLLLHFYPRGPPLEPPFLKESTLFLTHTLLPLWSDGDLNLRRCRRTMSLQQSLTLPINR